MEGKITAVVQGSDYYNYVSKKDNKTREGFSVTLQNPKGRNAKDLLIDFSIPLEVGKSLHLDQAGNLAKMNGKKFEFSGFWSWFNGEARFNITGFTPLDSGK